MKSPGSRSGAADARGQPQSAGDPRQGVPKSGAPDLECVLAYRDIGDTGLDAGPLGQRDQQLRSLVRPGVGGAHLEPATHVRVAVPAQQDAWPVGVEVGLRAAEEMADGIPRVVVLRRPGTFQTAVVAAR